MTVWVCPLYHVPEYGSSIAQTASIAGTSRGRCLNTCSSTPSTNTQSTFTNSLQPTALTHSNDSRCHSLTHSLTCCISLRQPTSHLTTLTIQLTTLTILLTTLTIHLTTLTIHLTTLTNHLTTLTIHLTALTIHLTTLTQALLPPLNPAPVCSTNLRHNSLH